MSELALSASVRVGVAGVYARATIRPRRPGCPLPQCCVACSRQARPRPRIDPGNPHARCLRGLPARCEAPPRFGPPEPQGRARTAKLRRSLDPDQWEPAERVRIAIRFVNLTMGTDGFRSLSLSKGKPDDSHRMIKDKR